MTESLTILRQSRSPEAFARPYLPGDTFHVALASGFHPRTDRSSRTKGQWSSPSRISTHVHTREDVSHHCRIWGGHSNGICKSRVIEASRSPATTPPIPILSRPLSHPISQFASYRFHHRTTELSGEKLKLPAVLLSRCFGVIHFLRLRHPSGWQLTGLFSANRDNWMRNVRITHEAYISLTKSQRELK